MTASRIDGKAVALQLRAQLKDQVSQFVARHGRPPGLSVVLVGEDPASVVYTRNKEKACTEAGMKGELHRLPADTNQATLLALLKKLNEDDSVDGILVQLPLPAAIDEQSVLDAVAPEKDVDGFHPQNVGLLSTGRPHLVPCTPRGCMKLIAETGKKLQGKSALVVGRSNIVGKPMAQLLLAENATVTIAHSRTVDLAERCKSADIVIAAVGRAKMIQGDWIKPGAVVIDVGINRDDDGKLVGDVDTAAASVNASHITPVPGGVGPMTIACLLENTLIAAGRRVGAERATS